MLNFDNQPLMLGKVVMEGLGLTNENIKHCPYQIFKSMGE